MAAQSGGHFHCGARDSRVLRRVELVDAQPRRPSNSRLRHRIRPSASPRSRQGRFDIRASIATAPRKALSNTPAAKPIAAPRRPEPTSRTIAGRRHAGSVVAAGRRAMTRAVKPSSAMYAARCSRRGRFEHPIEPVIAGMRRGVVGFDEEGFMIAGVQAAKRAFSFCLARKTCVFTVPTGQPSTCAASSCDKSL